MTKHCPMCGMFMSLTEAINSGREWECSRCEYVVSEPPKEEVWGVDTGAGRYR